MRLILATAALVLLMTEPAAAVQCQRHGGNGMSWRLVNGKKCWYAGRRRIDKRLLRWTSARAEQQTGSRVAHRSAAQEPAGDPLPGRWQAPISSQPVEVAEVPQIHIVTTRPVQYVEEPPPAPRVVMPSPYEPRRIEPQPEPRRGWLIWIGVLVMLGGVALGIRTTRVAIQRRLS